MTTMNRQRIVKLDALPGDDIQPLWNESRAEGISFVTTLLDEYRSGKNRFDQPGEALYAIYRNAKLVAVGGLNRDPYLPSLENGAAVGRVRHLYVLREVRCQGIGRLLMTQIIAAARGEFHLLTLRTVDDAADRFYCSLGFVTTPPLPHASHHLTLANGSLGPKPAPARRIA